MSRKPQVTIIICTYNAWYLLKDLIESIQKQTYRDWKVIINDDDRSKDNLRVELKTNFPKLKCQVLNQNESLGQARNAASMIVQSKYLVHLDADFQLDESVIEECVNLCERGDADALIIPEKVIGDGFWTKCRAFEKELYCDDNMMESPRFFNTKKYKSIGGHDPELAMSEDKDVDLRFRKAGYKVSRCKSIILHNERRISLFNTFQRKFFWAQSVIPFIGKHPEHSIKQGNVLFRPAFIRNWYRLLLHPIQTIGMFLLKLTEASAFFFGILYTKVLKKKAVYKN